MKECSIFLPNNESSTMDDRVLNVLVSIQVINTTIDFKVWSGVCYNCIWGMAWLHEVDAWIAYKEGEIHEKL